MSTAHASLLGAGFECLSNLALHIRPMVLHAAQSLEITRKHP